MVETFVYLTAAVAIGVFLGLGLLWLILRGRSGSVGRSTESAPAEDPVARACSDDLKPHVSDYTHD